MPSLRRIVSVPSVRPSPYRGPSSSSSSGPVQRNNQHGYRRASGSDTSTRRVLADIEWWRVVDGQYDFEAGHEFEDRNRDHNLDLFPGRILAVEEPRGGIPVAGELPGEQPTAADEGRLSAITEPTPTNALAALSIAHRLPVNRVYSRQSSRSSVSSLDSNIEAFGPGPFEDLQLTFPDDDFSFPGPVIPEFPILKDEPYCEAGVAPIFALHTLAFDDFVAFEPERCCADPVSPFPITPIFYD